MALPFVNTDPAAVLAGMATRAAPVLGKQLFPATPERLLLHALAYEHALLLGLVNHAANQNLIAFASGDHLDRLADLVGITRKPPAAASLTATFDAGAPVGADLAIPQGTRIAPTVAQEAPVFFETLESATILTGQQTVSVLLQATATGTPANGYLPGQLSTLVDPVAGIASVTNTIESQGGADLESDEAFRTRFPTELNRFVAGATSGYYAAKALEADPSIADVAVKSNTPGLVEITLLLEGGGLPTSALLSTVAAYLDSHRSLTDQVIVAGPVPEPFDVAFTYYVLESYALGTGRIAQEVDQAASDFAAWQSARLGRDLAPDELRKRVLAVEGVKRLSGVVPEFRVLAATSAPQLFQTSITFGGVEPD